MNGPVLHELQDDDEAPESAVAIRKRMQRLELVVGKGSTDGVRHLLRA
jgi:hypothetical protein